ncbi:MAG: CotH kinase family protein [Actinomycetota bacterium]|jgi:spore coat protein CotH|nr:CotH kinase family protein [Actinomycetota bacterium]
MVPTQGQTMAVSDDAVPNVEGDSSYIFDQSELRTYELTLTDDALEFLDNDPAAEEYVEGLLTFEGTTIGPVGVRYKGSIGAFVGCVSGRDFANPSGHKTCTKLSMKVKINWSDSKDEFYGLRKLQFHSQNLDATQLHERLGYWLFREMGVPVPRSVHARLMINGEFVGLFALTEQIDGRFTREFFDDGSGNLYKEVWPVTVDGRVQGERPLLDALRTNEDESPSVSLIQAFAGELLTSDEPKQTMQDWMHIDTVLAMAVVDRTIRNDDGLFHWYCIPDCGSHNFFWYEQPASGTLHVIPWDLDNAFENIVSNVNPVTPMKDAWGEISNDCRPFAYGGFQLQQRSAACDPIIGTWTEFETEYAQLLAEFLEGPFAEEQVDAVLDAWIDQIAGATAEASEAYDDALTPSEWETAVAELRKSLVFARAKAAA